MNIDTATDPQFPTVSGLIPPHLSAQPSPSIYPATRDAFMVNGVLQPNFSIELTRIKKKSATIVWILILVALVGFVASLLMHSIILTEGSACLFIVSLLIGVIVTSSIGTSRFPMWYDEISAPTIYTAILAYNSGMYLRRNGAEKDFTFLPWTAITGVTLEQLENKSSQILIATSATSVLSPSEFQTQQFPVLIEGAILNLFALDTPKKIAKALQQALDNSRANVANLAS